MIKLICLVLLFTTSVYAKNKVVYGDDNRVDVMNASAEYQELAAKTLALIAKEKFDENLNLQGEILGTRKMLCEDERFYHQLAPATCSSFLVAPDIVVTAGHCIKNQIDCDRFYFVQGFNQQYEDQVDYQFNRSQLYNCKQIIERHQSQMLDYAVIRLDRAVPHVIPFKFRKKGKVKKKTPVIIIGQPSGLPTKIADDAKVRGTFWPGYFTTTADAFGGNSGSAVINANNHQVEGILVRGEIDYVEDRAMGCMRVKRCKERRCQGEAATRITKIKFLQSL